MQHSLVSNGEMTIPHIDVYGRTNELEPQVLEAIAIRLEARRKSKR